MKKIIIIFLTLLLVACNEEPIDYNIPENPAIQNDFMPLNIGNYWIYDYFKYDDNDEVIDGTRTLDSIVVVASSEIKNQKVFKMLHFRDQNAIDTIFAISQKDSVFYFYDSIYNGFVLENELFLKVFDFSEFNWISIIKNFHPETVRYSDEYFNALSEVRLFTNFQLSEIYELNQKEFKVFAFKEIFDIKSRIDNFQNDENQLVDIELFRRNELTRYFADSVGLVVLLSSPKMRIARQKLNAVTIKEESEKSAGWVMRLIRFRINS